MDSTDIKELERLSIRQAPCVDAFRKIRLIYSCESSARESSKDRMLQLPSSGFRDTRDRDSRRVALCALSSVQYLREYFLMRDNSFTKMGREDCLREGFTASASFTLRTFVRFVRWIANRRVANRYFMSEIKGRLRVDLLKDPWRWNWNTKISYPMKFKHDFPVSMQDSMEYNAS